MTNGSEELDLGARFGSTEQEQDSNLASPEAMLFARRTGRGTRPWWTPQLSSQREPALELPEGRGRIIDFGIVLNASSGDY